jgi:hypothetical protein
LATTRHKLDTLRQMSWAERRVLLEALVALPLARVLARFLSFGREAAPGTAPQPCDPETLARARRTARLVAAAAHNSPFHASCLHRSVVTWLLLRRRGIDAQVRIGVRPVEPGAPLEAHAWVELDGIPLAEAADVAARYAVLDAGVSPRGLRFARD